MDKFKKRFIVLTLLTLLSIIIFMIIWILKYKELIFNNNINITNALINITRRRFIQMVAIIISSILIAISTLSFQTITQNRILTPSILGFDSIFIITQTLIVALFGSFSIFLASDYLNFLVSTSLMIIIVFLMFLFVLRKNKNNIVLLLLIGLVITQLASSITSFIQVFMNPEDFQNVLSLTNVNINAINEGLVLLSLPMMLILLWLFYKENKILDVMSLGEDNAINLGINYKKEVNKTLIYITISIAISTALVGPLSFLGLLVVNGAKEMFKSNKHKKLMLVSSMLAVLSILGGQVILDLINFKTPVTVLINLMGGIYLLYILIKPTIK